MVDHFISACTDTQFEYVSRLGVVGPYVFEEGGETVTVTSNRYCEMLENFLRPRLEEVDDSEDF